ncbi:MAG TPA: PH domain-containing protein [Candidatus Saccharimonadales bacterium]|nr:PH domain-containing protein [Candidatus Saccharimonadales bacterium]
MDADDIIGKDEKVLELVQRHWISVVPSIVGFLLISLAALVGFYLVGRYGDTVGQYGPVDAAILALIALLVFGLLLGYTSWVVYRQNRIIITDQNLYEVTQNSLFSRKISQFSLERMQDVSASQNGVFANLFGYGDVTVETASAEENFVFHEAPHPRDLATVIMEHHHQITKKNGSVRD